MAKTGMKKKKKKGVAYWKEKTWEVFSEYIRLRDAVKTTGTLYILKCCSCGRPYPAFGIGCAQAGHLIPGRHNAILFNEIGTNGQCYNCNCNLKGNWPGYVEFMKREHENGQEIIDKLLRLDKTIRQFTVGELQTMHADYKAKCENLRSQYGNPNKQDISERCRIETPASEVSEEGQRY